MYVQLELNYLAATIQPANDKYRKMAAKLVAIYQLRL